MPVLVMSKKRSEPEGPPGKRPRKSAPSEPGFDRWLGRQLHRIYDPVLHEPVPDEFLRLLEGFETRDGDAPVAGLERDKDKS